MDLLTLLKMFLFLGCICYTFTILSFIRRHLPRITWKKDSKKKEKKEDGRDTENWHCNRNGKRRRYHFRKEIITNFQHLKGQHWERLFKSQWRVYHYRLCPVADSPQRILPHWQLQEYSGVCPGCLRTEKSHHAQLHKSNRKVWRNRWR